MAQKKRRRKKLDTSKLVCFLLVGSGLLITQECIYLMRLCIKSNYMASAAWLTAALSLAQVIIITGGKCYFELVKSISTHAPAGGATCVRAFSFCGNCIDLYGIQNIAGLAPELVTQNLNCLKGHILMQPHRLDGLRRQAILLADLRIGQPAHIFTL